jgi:hypothetical protein
MSPRKRVSGSEHGEESPTRRHDSHPVRVSSAQYFAGSAGLRNCAKRKQFLPLLARRRLPREPFYSQGASPGMAATVEIKTGTRRLIEYFLSPLFQAGQESLRER